jgi:DnaD/phage-associated family protein
MPDDGEQAKAYKYIFEYVFEGKEPNERDFATAMFCMVKVNIDNANKRYLASVENGKKGGRPPKNKNLEKPSNNPDITYKEPKQNLNDNDNYNVNDNYNDNLNLNDNYKNIFVLVEKEFGRTLSSTEIDKLTKLEDEYGFEKVELAIKECCLNNIKTLAYLNGILKNWKDKTIDEIQNGNIYKENTMSQQELERKMEILEYDWLGE